MFGYKRRTFREHIDHLETHWCRLDVKTKEVLKLHWKRAWEPKEHITRFSIRLTEEQEALARNGITIPDEDKLQHYLLKMYNSNYFEQPMMTEWEKKLVADHTFVNAVTFFNDKIESIKKLTQQRRAPLNNLDSSS